MRSKSFSKTVHDQNFIGIFHRTPETTPTRRVCSQPVLQVMRKTWIVFYSQRAHEEFIPGLLLKSGSQERVASFRFYQGDIPCTKQCIYIRSLAGQLFWHKINIPLKFIYYVMFDYRSYILRLKSANISKEICMHMVWNFWVRGNQLLIQIISLFQNKIHFNTIIQISLTINNQLIYLFIINQIYCPLNSPPESSPDNNYNIYIYKHTYITLVYQNRSLVELHYQFISKKERYRNF
eukprot:TRINITY_DN11137_c0_g2_i1.p2 TRINITY_DN11137_c0_g2~~TRINITY_DN11137_c0_g2_i1.p2  ORF type:complete len:236 (+),score=-15.35 TRINITY_DN11137_c0_g2_i1:470-1177(+)